MEGRKAGGREGGKEGGRESTRGRYLSGKKEFGMDRIPIRGY
jgi:hypothetical protein